MTESMTDIRESQKQIRKALLFLNFERQSIIYCYAAFISLFPALLVPCSLHAQIINTIAGNGTPGFSGDGGPAISATLYHPTMMAIDTNDNIFFTDGENSRVRKISASGVITTVAGTGVLGDNGYGGMATNAALTSPSGIAIDELGNLYFADVETQKVKRIDTNGILTVVAGNGNAGYNGDNMPATDAWLNFPFAVAVDKKGNLFIGDGFNFLIRKVDTNGIISTYAGNHIDSNSADGIQATSTSISSVGDIIVDDIGGLYFSDFHEIHRIDSNGIITTICGSNSYGYSGDGGSAMYARFRDPYGIAKEYDGEMVVADLGNNRVRKIGIDGIIRTIAGDSSSGYTGDGGLASNAKLFHPTGVRFKRNGNLVIIDYDNNAIREIFAPVSNRFIQRENNALVIYPNPAIGSCFITLKTEEGITDFAGLALYNLLGQKIIETTLFANTPTPFRVDVPSGTYLVVVTQDAKQYRQMLTVTK